MGNVVTQEVSSRIKGDPAQEDLKWLSVDNAAIFHDSYVADQFDNLPAFEGTVLEEAPPKKDGGGVHEDPKIQRLLELLSPVSRTGSSSSSNSSHVAAAEVFDHQQQGGKEGLERLTRDFNANIMMRSRLLQRIHLALLREGERVRNNYKSSAAKKSGADSLAAAQGSDGPIDPASLLTMASMRVSLSLLKTLRGSNPQIFTDMCESLMALFELCPAQALQKVNADKAQRETLQQIADFACAVANTANGTERSYAMALLFSLGVSRGSVNDLLQVVRLLSEGTDRLPDRVAAPFWQRLGASSHEFKLALPNLFHPDGEEVSVKTKPSDTTQHHQQQGRMAALASDGTYLYIWNAHGKVLEKVGTGMHGTVAGTVYERNERVIKAVRVLKGHDEEEDDDEEQGGEAGGDGEEEEVKEEEEREPPTRQFSLLQGSSPPRRRMMRVVSDAPVFSAPSLEGDVLQMLDVGTEREVLGSREADGHSWVQTIEGWLCIAMDLEGGDDEEHDGSDEEEGTDEEDQDREGDDAASTASSPYSSPSLARRSSALRHTYVEISDGESRFPSLAANAAGGGGAATIMQSTSTTGGGGAAAPTRCDAWLGYVDGHLYFKAKVDCLEPLEVVVISAYNLQVQRIMQLSLPTILTTTPDSMTGASLPLPQAPFTPLQAVSPSLVVEEEQQGGGAVVAPAASGIATTDGDGPSEPPDNYATFEQGARFHGSWDPLLEASLDGTGVIERNVLLPVNQWRSADATGATRYVIEGRGDEPSQTTVQLDLGEERQLARIGLEYGGWDPSSRPALTGISIATSTDRVMFLTWSTNGWATGEALTASRPGQAVFCNLEQQQEGGGSTTTRGVRYIRVTFALASGAATLSRLYACGTLGNDGGTSPPAKAEPLIPIIISDGRMLLAIHVSKPVINTTTTEDEADADHGDDGEKDQKLHIHVIDHETGEVIRSSAVPTDLDQAALHRQGLATNGDNLLLLRLTNADLKRPVFSRRLIDVKAQEVMEETELAWDSAGGGGSSQSCSFVPQSFTYDIWNNLVWGLDGPHSKAAYWKNVGLPPRIHGRKSAEPRDMLVSLVPEYRLEGLTTAGPWEEAQEATVQATSILTSLDRCAEIYGVPMKAAQTGGGASDGANDILVSSGGKDDGFAVRLSVRGQNVSSSSGGVARGFNLVVLDSNYTPVDVRNFDTVAGSPYNELMLDYVSRLSEGTMVLVASKEDAATGLSALGKRALRSLGAEQAVEKMEGWDLFVLIGRKGAAPASVVQKIVKRGTGVALVRQRVSLTHVPLSVEPTKQTFSSLIKLILKNGQALLKDEVDRLEQAQVLSALSLLTTNVYQLVNATTPTSYKDYFDASELAQLQELLLRCIDSPPQANQGSRHISDSALKLFVAALDVFYPSATQRCNLLVDYMTQYVQGKLSPLETSVLGLLLKRISNPSSLLQLLDEQSKGPSAVGGSASLDLFNSILDISRTEAEAAIETCGGDEGGDHQDSATGDTTMGKGSIGRSAVFMLSSMVNQLLSQTVQSIVVAAEKASEQGGKDGAVVVDMNVLLHIFTRLSDASTGLLDKAVESAQLLAIPVLPHANDTTSRLGQTLTKSGSLSVSCSPTLTRELDAALKSSPVGALLPLTIFVIMELVRYQSPALISSLGTLAKALRPLTERVRRVMNLLPRDKKSSNQQHQQRAALMESGGTRNKVLTFESAHPYRSNANDTIILSMPKAERMVIVFDDQTATERDYDYLIFWKNDARTERWHTEEKLTGRNGSENWPGFGGRPPLVIEGDYANIQFHSDGSNEDWGWRFTATGEFKKHVMLEEVHWLVQLDKHLNACGAALAGALTVSVEWGGELEERNIMWMEDETLGTYASSSSSSPTSPPVVATPRSPKGGGSTTSPTNAAAASVSVVPPSSPCVSPRRGGGGVAGQQFFLDPVTEANLLQSLVQRPGPDSLGSKLVQKMRTVVREDRGHYESIDNAVYASMAALIKHNGLSADALAVAMDAREDIPEALVRVWKSGVKMRQFFQYGDVQAAHRREVEGSNHMPSVLERGPSIYSGAEDAVIDKTSKEIVEKAQFLLRLDAPRSAKDVARKRWALMVEQLQQVSKHEASGEGGGGGTSGRGRSVSLRRENNSQDARWAAVVSELHASTKIKSMLEYRRKASDKKNSKLTVTERLLRFLQMPAKIEEIEAIKDKRNLRAAHRADGVALTTTLLKSQTSPQDQVYLLSCFMKAMRACRHSKDSGTTITYVHYLNGLEGCSIESAARLTESFSHFLKAVVDILRSHGPYVTGARPAPVGADKQEALDGLLCAALQACSLDYDVKDHEAIEESDLVNILPPYLASSSATLRAAAWKLFEALLPRVTDDGHASLDVSTSTTTTGATDEPTNVSKQLLSLATRQLEAVAQSSRALTDAAGSSIATASALMVGEEEEEEEGSGHVVVLEGAVQLSRDMVGPVAAHVPLTLNTTYSMWVYRPKNKLDSVAGARMQEGSRVQTGADWTYGDQNGWDGNTGTVTSVDGTSVTVQWDGSTDKFMYSWGEVMEDKKVYDLVLVDWESGGTLLYKGAARLLDDKERRSWSAFHVSLTDSSNVAFRVSQGDAGWYSVTSQTRLPAETWVHVAVSTSPEAVKIYLNGTEDASKALHPDLLQVGPVKKNVVEIESPHPYNPDMEEYWTVEHPEAEGYTVTFSDETRTERNYDYVQLVSAEDNASAYGEKYSGGYNGSERVFPGLDGQPPLEINAPRFRVFFKSDRSNQDWGFKLIATVRLREGAAASSSSAGEQQNSKRVVEISDLNHNPMYLGQPPSYICHNKSAKGLIGNVVVFKSTLTEDSIKMLSSATTDELPTSMFESGRCLDVASLLDKCIRVMPAPTIKALVTPSLLESVMRLSLAPSFDARLAATRLCESLLPYADPKLVDVQSKKVDPRSLSTPPLGSMQLPPSSSAFLTCLLLQVGQVLTSPIEHHHRAVSGQQQHHLAVDGADSAFAITAARLRLLRCLAKSETWAPLLKDTVVGVLRTMPQVLAGLEGAIDTEAEAARPQASSTATAAIGPSSSPSPPERLLLTGVLGLLGGCVDNISVGCTALVELEDKKGVFEDCTVLALSHGPTIDTSPTADKDKAKKLQQAWINLGGFGDGVVVVLHSEPTKAALYPRTKLVPQPAKDPAFLTSVVEGAGSEVILSAFKEVLKADLSSRLPVYQPKTVEEDKVEVIESEHPYPPNEEKKWKLDFPGAKQMEITFDEQTRTDFGSVYVRFLKSDQGSDHWGEDKYTGRDRQQNWPGLQGRPPLVIPASTCFVCFHSDAGDSSDWGFKFTAKAHTVTVVPPPERPPLTSYAALVQLYMHGMKALATIIENVPAFVLPASSVTPLLVEAALLKPETTSQYIKKVEPMVLETKHPYDCNVDRYETVSFPGAKKILFVFDPRTTSEKGCDYMRVYKGPERTDYWGENQYSGGKDGSSHNWPGLGFNAPLEIHADHCVIYWHTDGSVVDWGWHLTLIPDFGKGDGLEKMPIAEVMTRTYFMSQYLHDGPMPQPLSEALETFAVKTQDDDKAEDDVTYDGSILLTPLDKAISEAGLPSLSKSGGTGASSSSGGVVGRTFVVNYQDAEKVHARVEPRAESASLAVLEADTVVTALEECKDWLRVKYLEDGGEGWVLRREGDLIYLVQSDATAEGVMTISNEALTCSSSSDSGGGSGQRTNPMYECTDTVTAAVDAPMLAGLLPSDCLRGQTLRLVSALTESTRFGALSFARQSVSALISSWPEREPFSLSAFGGASQFLRFLRISFDQEKKDIKNSPKLAVLKQKILQVLRGDKQDDAQSMALALVSFSIQELQACSELQAMLKPTKAQMRIVETAHNYPDNADEYWPVSFAGAKRLKLVFDPRCSTEHNCDYVVIYKDGNHSSDNRWTSINYTGRQNDVSGKNWPGVGGRPPLYIDSDHCEVHFHSDASNNDWGVKLYCYGIMSEPTAAEMEAFREKKEQHAGSIELACWLLEFMAAEPLAAVQEGLYSRMTLRTLRKYMESAEDKDKMWMVHLVSSMLGHLRQVRLSSVAAAEVRRLVASLKDMAVAQFKAEESCSADRKSSLLQALIQATVLGETSPACCSGTHHQTMAVGEDGEQDQDGREGGVSETKEETVLLEEKGDDEEQEQAASRRWLTWSKSSKSPSLVLSEGGRLASCSVESGTVLSSRAVSRGAQTWRLCLVNLPVDSPALTIGAAVASFSPSTTDPQVIGQAPETFAWTNGQLLHGETVVDFGPKHLKSGDIISVTIDNSRGTMRFTRNKANVGVAFGPPGSGSAMELPTNLLGGGVAYRLAVVLPAGSSVRLLAPGDPTAAEDLNPSSSSIPPMSSSSSTDAAAGFFFDKVRDAVDYLRAFSERRIPSAVVRKEFLAPLRERHKVVLESAHPFDSKGFVRDVSIPGATALEVRLDWNTCVGRNDVLEISSQDQPCYSFKGLEHGTDASSFACSIGVGDLVVRGPAWEWGEQDGGVGSLGEVVEIKSWKGKTNAGVLVHWQETDYTALYRWGYDSKYDLIYFGPGNHSTRPITIAGSSVMLALTTVQDEGASTTQNDATSTTTTSNGWKGAFRFNEPQAGLTLPQDASYDLLGDFTIEAWVRRSGASAGGGDGTIVSRGVDLSMDGQQMYQLYFRVSGEGYVAFSMMNTDMQVGIRLSSATAPGGAGGGTRGGGVVLAPDRWMHVAVTAQERTVRLYVNGVEAASGSFQGARLDTLSANLVVGSFVGSSDPWYGHLYDFRVWTRALSAARLVSLCKAPLKPLEGRDGLVARFLTAPPEGAHVIFNTAVEGNAPAVLSGGHWDEQVDLVGLPTSSSSQPWGYKITVLPIYPIESLASLPGVAAEFAAFSEPYLSKGGDLRHDLALVRYVNSLAQKKGMTEAELLTAKWDDIVPAEADLVRLPLLRDLMSGGMVLQPPVGGGSSAADALLDKSITGSTTGASRRPTTPVQCRYAMVQLLNACLKDVLCLIDLGTIDKEWSMAASVSKCRGLIYTVLKQPVWQEALVSTTVSSNSFDLKLSKSKAAKYYNQVDHEARTTVFSQAFRQIHPMNPRSLRRADKLYNVFWMGERSHDAGGPYRESWSFYCSELQSPSLPLLRRTQNGIHAIGQNREQWVLNPGATSATHMELFFFLGKIMGIVIRNQEFLHLDLSPVVWKLLVQDTLTLEDLEAVDVDFVRSLRTIRHTAEEAFEESFSWLDFTTQSSDEQMVELVPDGANQPVTFANRLEYVRLLEQYRLHEFDRQAAAVRAGLATIVPQRLLALFSWEELETMICGQKHMDVDLLRSVTEYSSCRADDLHVRYFWQTLENFTNEERSMFLRFCWGRSRLPLRADAFPQRFKLQSFGRSPADLYLPVSHTCFFSLELPAYSTQEVMQQKLTYAIYNCQAIDGDDTSVGMLAASMGWAEDD